MFFLSNKEINRLLSKIINGLRKDINRFLSKGMSNIYLKFTIEKNWRSQTSIFNFFGELQLTQTSLNFKTCCNLKIRGLGAKLGVAFLLFQFRKEL